MLLFVLQLLSLLGMRDFGGAGGRLLLCASFNAEGSSGMELELLAEAKDLGECVEVDKNELPCLDENKLRGSVEFGDFFFRSNEVMD